MKRCWIVFTAFVITLALSVGTSAAVTITVVAPESGSILISGISNGQQATYKSSFWISATDDVPLLSIVPSTLTSTGIAIPTASIHINSGTPVTLTKNVPREIVVSVDTALKTGDLTGTLKLTNPKEPSTTIASIPVALKITPKPDVTIIPSQFAFKVTRCGSTFTCGLADFLLPKELGKSYRKWGMVNHTPSDVAWQSSAMTLRGDKTGDVINPDVQTLSKHNDPSSGVEFQSGTPLTANHTVEAIFQFDRSAIQPDHYQGQYRAELKDGDPVTIASTLDVRDGPLLPLFVLVLGIVVGRLLQFANTPQALMQTRLLDKYYGVQAAVNGVHEANARRSLLLRMSQVLVYIRALSMPEANISNELDLILRLTSDSNILDELETSIQQEADPTRKVQLTGFLSAARAAILAADAAVAEQNINQINGALPQPPGALRMLLLDAQPHPDPQPENPAPNKFARFVSWLSGAGVIDGDRWYRYGRPLMFILLLVLLSLVGLYNSYVKNASFGVDGLFDYLSLFLWGISADVAQKTLQNLSLGTRG
jgi:hypothetical protein